MNPSYSKVLRYLTGKENIDDVSVDELQRLTDENPYFSVSHFLLTKKIKREENTGFEQQLQKSVLYFSNPFWLQYQLSDDPIPNVFSGKEDDRIDAAKFPKEELLKNDFNELSVFESQNELKPVEEQTLRSEGEDGEVANEEENSTLVITKSSSAIYEFLNNNDVATQADEEVATLVPEPNFNTEVFLDQLDSVVLENTTNSDKERLQQDLESTQDETVTATLEEMAGATSDTNGVTETFLDNAGSAQRESEESAVAETSVTSGNEQDSPMSEPDEHEKMFQNIKAMLDASSEEADADVEDAVIPIDPYYTIDYFASQGIKLELEPNPKDQLGQNLKKFTHWLKHMKKLGPEDATEVISRTHNDSDIQQIAETSNTVREVVTEAMASVLEKQGKKDKAIELYKKLSFLIPDKSAYFATKIKNLKGI